MIEKIRAFSKTQDPRLWAILLSILVSLLWYSYQQPINIDGITYLQVANDYLQGGFKSAFKAFNWPLYPIFIAIISRYTHLSLLYAAYLFNTLLVALVISAFVSIVRNLGASKSIQWLAVFVILFYPKLANERTFIFRDFGYYAFMLYGLNALIIFEKKPYLSLLVCWWIFTFIASLFRIEGILFLILIPWLWLFLFQIPIKQKIKYFITANVLSAFLIVTGCLFLLLYKTQTLDLHNTLNLISTDFIHVFNKIIANFQAQATILKRYLLNIYSQGNAFYILLGAYIAVFISAFVIALNIIYLFLSYYGLKNNLCAFNNNRLMIYSAYILINCIILFGFIAQNLFSTTRYILFLAILFLLPVPYSIAALWGKFKFRKLIIAIALLFAVMSSIHIGADKTYVKNAGYWVQKHTATTSRFYINTPPLVYYCDRPGTKFPDDFNYFDPLSAVEFLNKLNKTNYDYVAMYVAKKDVPVALDKIRQDNLQLLASFSNNRHDKIFILKI